MSGPPSPEEFAAFERRRPKCRVCASPQRADIERARNNGVTQASLVRWAATHYPDQGMTFASIQSHFAGGHDKHSVS